MWDQKLDINVFATIFTHFSIIGRISVGKERLEKISSKWKEFCTDFFYLFEAAFTVIFPHWWASNWDLVIVSPHLGQFKIVHKWAALTWFSNKYSKRYLRGPFWHLYWTLGWVNLLCLLRIFSNLKEWKQWSQVCIMPKCCDSKCKFMSTLEVKVLSHSSQGIFSLIIDFGFSDSILIGKYILNEISNFKNVTLLFLLAILLLFWLRQSRKYL